MFGTYLHCTEYAHLPYLSWDVCKPNRVYDYFATVVKVSRQPRAKSANPRSKVALNGGFNQRIRRGYSRLSLRGTVVVSKVNPFANAAVRYGTVQHRAQFNESHPTSAPHIIFSENLPCCMRQCRNLITVPAPRSIVCN